MNRHILRVLFLLIVMAPAPPILAAEFDNALWTSLDIKKKLGHGFALTFEEEYRLDNDFSRTDKFQTSLELSYKFLPFLKAGAAYTRIDQYKPSTTSYYQKHRGYAFLEGAWSAGRFGFSLKERYQKTYRSDFTETVDDANPVDVLRTKLSVDYNIKGLKLKPYASCEVHYVLNEPDGKNNPPSSGMVGEIRYAGGLEYSLKKNLDLELGYLLSAERGWDHNLYGSTGGYKYQNTGALTLGLGYTF